MFSLSHLLILLLFIQVHLSCVKARAHFHLEAQQERVDFVCPNPDGFFHIPGTCGSAFIVCVGGVPYEQNCPGQNIFDPQQNACVNPNVASCNNENFKCPSSGGFYPVPGQCTNQYYTCLDGVAYVSYCPPNSLFDPILGVCVAEEFVSCRTTTTVTTRTTIVPDSTTTTTSPISIQSTPTTTTQGGVNPGYCPVSNSFVCPGDGIFEIPGAVCCNKFYKCSNRTPYLFECPDVTIFNPSNQVCDWNYNVPGCVATRPPFLLDNVI